MAKKDIQNRKKELQEEIQATKDLAAAQLALIKNAQTWSNVTPQQSKMAFHMAAYPSH